uniref:Uncharacterized protein n=1 Tax=Tanacetum cinerariifolium TaxID=118510 RepID=A0A699L0L7_TANCI|nr:hypothetical protein [Tanacetum cinerariifolium]
MEIKSYSYYEYRSFESFTCWQINLTEEGEDSVGSSTLDAVANVQTPKLKRLPVIEDSDAETSGDSSGCVRKNKAGTLSDNKRRKWPPRRVLIEDSIKDVSCGTPEDGNKDRAGSRSDKKKG